MSDTRKNPKKVSFGVRPTLPADAEQWIQQRQEHPMPVDPVIDKAVTLPANSISHDSSDSEAMKRLTIDIPESLHRAIKTACASRGSKIADEVRQLLAEHYGKA